VICVACWVSRNCNQRLDFEPRGCRSVVDLVVLEKAAHVASLKEVLFIL
jgi:hypothetical protein